MHRRGRAGLGVGATVESLGCADAEQALIVVTVSTDDERDRVDDILTPGDGFGVPVYVHRE